MPGALEVDSSLIHMLVSLTSTYAGSALLAIGWLPAGTVQNPPGNCIPRVYTSVFKMQIYSNCSLKPLS